MAAELQTVDHDKLALELTHVEKKRKTMGCKVEGEAKCRKKERYDDGMSKNGDQGQLKAKKRKDKKKAHGEAPTGYVHVRARRGQATDDHSLAERARREKICERMRLLQSLVPGGDKITGKALILDEIINYVQSLQNQVEFLVMKLASAYPIFSDLDTSLLDSELRTTVIETTPVSTSFLLRQDYRSILVFQEDGDVVLGDIYG